MFANVVKWIFMSTLVIAALSRLEGGPRILLQLVICGGAAFVMVQAARSRRFLWMLPFGLVAIYFNPILPIELSRPAELPVLLASLRWPCLAMAIVGRTFSLPQ